MKVLFFSHQAEFIYGGEVCTLAFMRELTRRGVEVHFASPSGPYQDRAKAIARCHTVSSVQFSRRVSLLPKLLPAIWRTRGELRQILKEQGIPILHTTSLKAMAYARGVEAKIIWHHHDILPAGGMNDGWLRFLAGGAQLILAPSEATRQALLRAGVEELKCKVLRNGFSISEWQPRPVREASSQFKVALIGEISPRKGTDRLPGILASLRERGGIGETRFVVIGEGLTHPEFATEMRMALRPEPVTFLGRREDVRELYRDVDLLLVPSRQDPLPTVIVEAFLSGVPAVGTRVGGIPEMILPGKNGFLADADEEFADAIIQARELSEWRRLSLGARAFAEQKFDVEKLGAELMEHYHALA